MNGANKFMGVCLIYVKDKDDINKEINCDISYMSKKRGTAAIHIF